jgi:hypothetical protein
MVTETRADEAVLKNGMPDVEAIRPLSFMPGANAAYYSMGWKLDPER